MQGKVLKLFVTHKERGHLSKKTITLDRLGVKDDKFYNKDAMRSILLSSLKSYELAFENTICLQHGDLGENILIDIDPYGLVAGDKIRIGTAVLEITQNCTLCSGLSTLHSQLPKLLKKDRGIFAKVIEGSFEVNINDKVEILSY